MKTEVKDTCSLCFKVAEDSTAVIDETTLEVLKSLALNLDFSGFGKPVLCKDCLEKLRNAYTFKSACKETENILSDKNCQQDERLGLKTIFLKEIENNYGQNQVQLEICRLCRKIVNNESFTNLINVLEELQSRQIFEMHFRQVALDSTENPVVCETCLISLKNFFDFMFAVSCVSAADYQSQGYKELEIVLIKKDDLQLNTKEFIDNVEETTRFIRMLEKETIPIKSEPVEKIRYQAEHSVKTRKRRLKKRRPDKNSKNSAATVYKCKYEFCKFKSRFKYNLNRHIQRHKKVSNSNMFRCHICAFQTKVNEFFENHMVISHGKKLLSCDVCPFKSYDEDYFEDHVACHMDPLDIQSEIKTETEQTPQYKCHICDFVTRYPVNVERHMLVHKDLSELEIFQCAKCKFNTIHKNSLNTHMKIHTNTRKVVMQYCHLCPFQTMYKVSLKRHISGHNILTDPTIAKPEMETFKCSLCEYSTVQKGNLSRHLLVHKNPKRRKKGDVELHTCSICGFVTKYKKNLERHMFIHSPKPTK